MVLLSGGCDYYTRDRVARDIQESRLKRTQRMLTIDFDPNASEMEELEILGGTVNLDDCIELALIHNKDVQNAKVRLLESQGQMTEAVSTAMPSVVISGSAMSNDNTGFDTRSETYMLQLLARQPLYLGGLTGAALDAAVVFGYQTRQELRQTIQAVQLQVRQNYIAALLAQELVNVSLQSRINAQKLVEESQKKLRYGSATRFEVLQAEVRLNSIEANLIRAQNEASLAKTRLLDALGVSQLSRVELSGKLEYEPVQIAEAKCFPIAMQRRPDLLIGEAMIRLALDNIKQAQATNRPKLYLQTTYARSKPSISENFASFANTGSGEEDASSSIDLGGGDSWDRTWSTGLVLEWPIFDGFATDGMVVKAKAFLQKQKIALQKLEQQSQLEITQTLLYLENSEKFVKVQISNVQNAEEALRLAQVGYREGTVTSLDVISSDLALAQARSDYHNAVYTYQLAQLNLNAALGTIGEEPLPLLIPEIETSYLQEPPDEDKINNQEANTEDNIQ
ncbi:MAG: TolC family protein [Sedimentisphaerales bacterium]|nr:TolC family protein [Sedimentisphaerales bacterium]